MRITIVAAMGENGVIGDGERLPWRLPADLKRFRRITWGHPLIMGRRTFESIGKPLPGRTSIILSRDPDYQAEGCRIADSLASALAIASQSPGGEEIMIVGGGDAYRLALPISHRIHLTRVEGTFPGSVEFPKDFARDGEWRVTLEEMFPADAENPHDCEYFLLERPEIAPPSARPLTDAERESGFRRS